MHQRRFGVVDSLEPMTPDDIRAAIRARPEPSLQQRAAWAMHAALTDAQTRGVPSPERVALLHAFHVEWQAMEREQLDADLEAVAS